MSIEPDSVDTETEEIFKKFRETEQEGVKDILKYFNRIHDKLFTLNSILVAGYFALAQLYDSISILQVIIPLINFLILLYVDYRMLGKSRFEADITNKTPKQIEEWGKSINRTNLISFITIVTTLIVAGIFVYNLFVINQCAMSSRTF